MREKGLLLDTMFEVPSEDNVEEVIVKAENIKNNTNPLVVYSDKKKAKKKKDTKLKDAKKADDKSDDEDDDEEPGNQAAS